MNYGTAPYGSTALGGTTASQWFIFLPFTLRAAGEYEAEAELNISDPWFSLFLRKAAEETDVIIAAFIRNDPGETPQAQGTFGGMNAQSVIPSARFIKVVATINAVGGEFIVVKGRAGQ